MLEFAGRPGRQREEERERRQVVSGVVVCVRLCASDDASAREAVRSPEAARAVGLRLSNCEGCFPFLSRPGRECEGARRIRQAGRQAGCRGGWVSQEHSRRKPKGR